MNRAVDALAREMGTIRTGRASAALVEGIKVEAYGGLMPLQQVAGISVPEARLIVIQPWDRTLLGAVERALQKSDLGLTPANDGNLIRLPIPTLTEERRKDLVRLVRKHAEEGRVEVRRLRREGNEELKAAEKEGKITQDGYHHLVQKVQELTDRTIGRLDEVLSRKENEIMEE